MFFYLAKDAVVHAAAVDADRPIDLLWRHLDLDGLGAMGAALCTAGAILLLIGGLSPLGNALILPLEDRFPRADLDAPPRLPASSCLAARRIGWSATARGAPALNEAGERMIEAAMLARRFPDAKIAFTGGEPEFLQVRQRSRRAGYVAHPSACRRDRLILEAKRATPRRTRPSSRMSSPSRASSVRRALASDHVGLSHAARHGPFRKAGFDVEPWPVDYRTRGQRRPDAAVRQGLRGLAPGGYRRPRMGRAGGLSAGRAGARPYFRGRCDRATGCDLSKLAAIAKPRQHSRVDPVLEIGCGAELRVVLAGEGRHHLA